MFRRIIKYSNKHFSLFKKLTFIADRRIKPRINTIKIVTAIICMQFCNLGSLNSKQKKTTYRVWDHQIEGCWDGYGKKVRVIVSEETTAKRAHACDGVGWEEKTEVANWMWVTNLFEDFSGDLKNTVKVCHSRWQIENSCFNETVNTWKADHIYRHSANAIIAFLLLLFTCVNIFNIFLTRNIKDRAIKTKVFLIDKIKAEFLSLKRPLPPVPIPI